MAFSINTNIAGLQAQEYLRAGADFQSKTINRVTSGLRILSSGDDAAGLAIANGMRSDRAVLTQGIRNANDGLSALQTIDGGMSNISQLLDRARTLATQSASGTYTGSRSVLNDEFSNVMTEIDRQSQAIGLNSNGEFAKSLSVFIGGGRSSGGTTEISNGSVGVDLRTSTVDTQSLGLKGVQAGKTGYDLSSGTTEVVKVVSDDTNTAALKTTDHTVFKFVGAGFGDQNSVDVSVNVNNVASTDQLVSVINDAINLAATGATSAAAAFKAAGITAKVVTDDDGQQQIAFSSSKSAFQVVGGDRMANAILGDFGVSAAGAAIASTVAGDTASAAVMLAETISFRFTGGGLDTPKEISLLAVAGETQAAYGARLATLIANDSTLSAAGITVTNEDASSVTGLQFSARSGDKINVSITGDSTNRLAYGLYLKGGGGEHEYSTITTGTEVLATTAGTTRFSFSLNGGATEDVDVVWTAQNRATAATASAAINAAINAKTSLDGLGLTAVHDGVSAITFTSTGGDFRLQVSGSAAAADFGSWANGVVVGQGATNQSAAQYKGYISAGSNQLVNGAGAAAPLAFSGINFSTDDQALTIQANDALGASHSIDVTLTNVNARDIDDAIGAINDALQLSNDSTLKQISAVKVNDGGAEKITLVSNLSSFRLNIGKTATANAGIDQTNVIAEAGKIGTGANANIDTQAAAETAVTALSAAVNLLGNAQAVVGRGQNQFNYAVSLASTQLTNLAASESRIRDADLAMEAANLTKAQVLQQAGIAALAQANSAPQAVLSLLKG